MKSIKLYIPGSTMFYGEHVVLRGAWGLRAAVDKGMTLAFMPRPDRTLSIFSQKAVHKTDVDQPAYHPELAYVLESIKAFLPLPFGLDIRITSDLGAMGLGSSAAIVAGMVTALWLYKNPGQALEQVNKQELWQAGLDIIHRVTGQIGSGADLAASLHGGIVAIRNKDIIPLPVPVKDMPLTLIYSGYKTPTHTVVKQVNDRENNNPDIYRPLLSRMQELANQTRIAVEQGNPAALAALFDQYYDCQKDLGVSDPKLDRLVKILRQDQGVIGVKIAGAGLGDCVIGLGWPVSSLPAPSDHVIRTRIAPGGIQAVPWNKQDIITHVTGGPKKPAKPQGEGMAPVNIALVKYWGKRDEALNLPVTDSLSVSLPWKTRTVIKQAEGSSDIIILNEQSQVADSTFYQNTVRMLDLFRPEPEFAFYLKTYNDLPTAAGLASSASGIAALVLALNDFYGWNLPQTKLSILARLLSGSACRSVFGSQGFVRWHKGEKPDGLDSYGELLRQQWPGLCLGIVMVQETAKTISSRQGMKDAMQSPLYQDWPAQVDKNMAEVLEALRKKDFHALGKAVEENAIAMHRTTVPEFAYFLPETHAVLNMVRQLRVSGIPVYVTMDAGPNVKILFEDNPEIVQVLEQAFGKHFQWSSLF